VIYEQVSAHGDTHAIAPSYGKKRALNGRRQIINPGSVGQPRDANPDAAYALLDVETNTWEHRRVAYNIPAVQARMRAVDMPERLIVRLEHGW
jgi:diadenosine tetraphosphatase ApaH/serine/threonine PP2A family protein phosphatase